MWINTLSSECDKIMHASEYEFVEKWEKRMFSELWELLNFHITLPKHIFCYFEGINMYCSETILLMASSFLISKIWEVPSLYNLRFSKQHFRTTTISMNSFIINFESNTHSSLSMWGQENSSIERNIVVEK